MKKLYIALTAALLSATIQIQAQDTTKKEIDDKYVENDVVSLAGKKGFSFSTKAGDFLFKPYALVQASATYNRYDDQGLESHYAKNVANSGFAIPNAILGQKWWCTIAAGMVRHCYKRIFPYPRR